MRMYHGSYMVVQEPQVHLGRTKVDFGQGFYLTSIKEQAEKWSRVISIRKGPRYQAVVNEFELDMDVFSDQNFVSSVSQSMILSGWNML